MQDMFADRLVSKRIPTVSKIAALPHLIAERLAPASRKSLAAVASHPAAKAAGLGGGTHKVPLTGPTEAFTYIGTMTISGNLTATSNQTGTWSGSLHETMTIYEDSLGNGFASEELSGNVTLDVHNPDGSSKSETNLLAFSVPSLTLTGGTFSDSEPSDGLGGNLLATLELNGAFAGSHAVLSETMHTPFSGFVNGVLVSGALNGSSQLTAKTQLVISGGVANQSTFAAMGITPFKNIGIVDLNSVPVTATLLMSNPKNGTLTNLDGGKYSKATGTYTITGSADAVDSALDGLSFIPAGGLGSYNRPVKTGFAIKVTDTTGAALTNRATSVIATQPLTITGVSPHLTTPITKADKPFSHVTISDAFNGEVDFIAVKLSNLNNGTLTNLGGGFYNKKTGLYTIKASAASATVAVRGLEFVPSTAAGATSTSFTIHVFSPGGASIANSNTTVAVAAAATTPATAVANGGVALFTQYVATGLYRAQDQAAGIAGVHELAASSHLELTAGHR